MKHRLVKCSFRNISVLFLTSFFCIPLGAQIHHVTIPRYNILTKDSNYFSVYTDVNRDGSTDQMIIS